MYKLDAPIIHKNDEKIETIKKLFEEVFGYTSEEINQFIKSDFMCDVAMNLTIDQATLATKPFADNDINIYLETMDGKIISYHEAGIYHVHETPKQHYYDKPVVSREQLVDPFTQKEKERLQHIQQNRLEQIQKNIPKCPTCQSTNISKISTTKRLFSTGLFGLASSDIGKTMKCNKCGYKW